MSIYNMSHYKRERRAHWFKKIMAWIGILAAGSLVVFVLGVFVLTVGVVTAVAPVVALLLLAWGFWGFFFLKTRH